MNFVYRKESCFAMLKGAQRTTSLPTGKRMGDMKNIPKCRMPDSGSETQRGRANAEVPWQMYRPPDQASSPNDKEVSENDDSRGSGGHKAVL